MIECKDCGKRFDDEVALFNHSHRAGCEIQGKSPLEDEPHPTEGRERAKETKKKISKARKGRNHSAETKEKISDTLKGKYESGEMEPTYEGSFQNEGSFVCSECGKTFGKLASLAGHMNAHSDKENTGQFGNRPAWNKGMSKEEMMEHYPDDFDFAYWEGKESPKKEERIMIECKGCGKEFKKPHYSNQKYCSIECYLENQEWDMERRKKAAKGAKMADFSRKPTKPEVKFMDLCDEFNLPYKYVGNGDFWIENKNPDFVNCNGKKVAVEILGDYWHTEKEFEERQELFRTYGWKCIGIWEHEIMSEDNVEKIVHKVSGAENEMS